MRPQLRQDLASPGPRQSLGGERLSILGGLLACGVRRMRVRQSSQLSLTTKERLFDFASNESLTSIDIQTVVQRC